MGILTSVELERRCLSLAYKVVTEDLGKQVTLVGAFALYLELSKLVDNSILTYRQTTDIDLTTYLAPITEDDYHLFYKRMVHYLGSDYQLELKPAIVRDGSVTFKFRVSGLGVVTSLMKIDFNYDYGQKLYDIQPLSVSLGKKIALSSELADRRVKDKVDVITILYYLFHNGVSKEQLLRTVQESGQVLNLSEDWVSDELFESKVIRSTRRFKPEYPLPNLHVLEIVRITRVLLIGLVNKDLPATSIFRGGSWFV